MHTQLLRTTAKLSKKKVQTRSTLMVSAACARFMPRRMKHSGNGPVWVYAKLTDILTKWRAIIISYSFSDTVNLLNDGSYKIEAPKMI